MEYNFLASYLLVLAALWYAKKESLGIEKTLFTNSLLAFFQLLLLGFALGYIFKLQKLWQIVLVILLMSLYGSWLASRRTKIKNGFFKAFVAIGVSAIAVLTSLVIMGIIDTKANHLVPIAGMILGNSLNIYTQALERLKSEANNTKELIEGMTALGATLKEAMSNAMRHSVKAAMIPTINSLQTVGVIHIPGVTVGMLLAGASPLQAVSYQLVIMYMLVAVSVVCAVITASLCYSSVLATVSD